MTTHQQKQKRHIQKTKQRKIRNKNGGHYNGAQVDNRGGGMMATIKNSLTPWKSKIKKGKKNG